MDAMELIVGNIVKAQYADIPPAAVARAKVQVIDTLGVMIAGSTAPGCKPVIDMVRDWGGKPEATIAVYGGKFPAPEALWCNAMMGRARDFDDDDEVSGDHPGDAAVPTAMVFSEMAGGTTGKDVIAALALACDTVARVRRALSGKLGAETITWGTGFYSFLTSAVVASKLLKLDRNTMMDAMGLAYCQMSNTIQGNREGTLSIRVHMGMGARGGLLAALLARAGITGPHHVLEGEKGLYPAYARNEYDRNILLNDLGKNDLITQVSVKPFPACKLAHCSIEAGLRLAREYDIKPGEISRVVVRMNKATLDDLCQPEKVRPRSVPAAQFSVPYCTAAAIVKREVTLHDFTEEGIKDPAVLAVSDKIECVADPEITAMNKLTAPMIVEITLRDGNTRSARVETVKGHPENPMSFEECVAKFRACLPFAAKTLPASNVENIVGMVHDLENVGDVSRIARLMA